LEEANWRPRIDAVSNCLSSWRTRSLSYQGKALVINALVLSRVWYVASLLHMPPWVLPFVVVVFSYVNGVPMAPFAQWMVRMLSFPLLFSLFNCF